MAKEAQESKLRLEDIPLLINRDDQLLLRPDELKPLQAHLLALNDHELSFSIQFLQDKLLPAPNPKDAAGAVQAGPKKPDAKKSQAAAGAQEFEADFEEDYGGFDDQ